MPLQDAINVSVGVLLCTRRSMQIANHSLQDISFFACKYSDNNYVILCTAFVNNY